jgi:hypothetical protein
MTELIEITQQPIAINNTIKLSSINEMTNWYNDFVKFTQAILKKDLDYGVIPGTGKPCLYKAGAEKLRVAYGFGVQFQCIENKINWSPLYVDCTYKAIITTKSGQIIAECEGNVNSEEQKYKYVWVSESDLPNNIDKSKLKTKNNSITEFEFAINKAETTGQYGKPAEYWQKFQDAINSGEAKIIKKKAKSGKEMIAYEIPSFSYRIPNPDVVGLKNTMMKMAQKRAFVGAVLIATGASEFFTQDLEDLGVDLGFNESEIIITPTILKNTVVELTPEQKQQKIKDSIESSFIDLKNNDGTFQEWTDLIQTLVTKYSFLVSSQWFDLISEKYKPEHPKTDDDLIISGAKR